MMESHGSNWERPGVPYIPYGNAAEFPTGGPSYSPWEGSPSEITVPNPEGSEDISAQPLELPSSTVDARPGSRVQEVHYINGERHEGVHPDRDVQEKVAELKREITQYRDTLHTLLEKTPNENSRYESLVATERADAIAEFGPRMAHTPVTILAPEKFHQLTSEIGKRIEGMAGFCTDGHIVVMADPEMQELYGEEIISHHLAHEFGHAGIWRQNSWAIKTYTNVDGEPMDARAAVKRGTTIWAGFAPKYGAPSSSDGADLQYEGAFFDEGLPELYAHRRSEARDPERLADFADAYTYRYPVGYDGQKVELSNKDAPGINADGSLVVPWRYAVSAVVVGEDPKDGRRAKLQYGQYALAVYGIDLLEGLAPGIHGQLQKGSYDPAARAVARERINALGNPGHPDVPLYNDLMRVPNTGRGLARGLHLIMRASGIEQPRRRLHVPERLTNLWRRDG